MKRKIFYGILIALLIALVVIGTYIYNLFNSFEKGVSESFEATDRDRSELRIEDINPEMDSFTILILGIDESESRNRREDMGKGDYRTDTMILATFDKDQEEVKLVSIPRDTLTYFPEENYFDKITHAHREGGPDGSMRAVESLLNVPVDFYIRTNMDAVVDIVDALGGVEFDVPFEMSEQNSKDKGKIELKEGKQTLNGEEALAVVRNRKVDSDLGRGQRQLELVQAILSKAKSTGALSKLDELIEVVADNTKHNMESKTIRSLAAYYSFNDINFNTTQIKGSDFWFQQNGAYFYWANEEHLYRISETLREVLGLEAPDPYDLINIRLSEMIVPYQFIEGTELEDYQAAEPPYFMREGYDSQLGNGFNTEEGQDEESVEAPDRDMNPEFTDEEPTTEQPSVEDSTAPQYEESTQEPYYEEETQEPYQEDAAPYYEEETQEPYYEENTQETPSYDGV
ncbi:hypothetical protein GCM10022378_17350 [Salinicoccus jeotgali]|uniref:Cell envelope-related transcriptional attenuator domain-containing protein n=1 Tax=Salinicoccus jeotgali TaxID=381634 RepID=A0ABP7F221_9STAP